MQLREVPTPFNFQPPPPARTDFLPAEEQAMQRAIINLFAHWGLTDAQASLLLGGVNERTFQRWKQGQYGRVGTDLAARMSNLIGIHKALRLLFTDKERGYRWIKQANAAFNGASALDIMLRGQFTDVMRVRRYLDAQRSPW